jgi:hypothetical protein
MECARDFMDILDIKLQKELTLEYKSRVALEERISTAKTQGKFVLPIIVCARLPTGKWMLSVTESEIQTMDRLLLDCPKDSIKSKHVDFGDLLCDMIHNQTEYRRVLGYVHYLTCQAGEVYKVQRIQARIELEDFSSSDEEADGGDEQAPKKKKKETSWWSGWFRRSAPKKYGGDVLIYKIIADFFNTIVQKDRIHPSSLHESHSTTTTTTKKKKHPTSVVTSNTSVRKKKKKPTQRLAPTSRSEDEEEEEEEEDEEITNMSFLNPSRSRTPSSSSGRSTPTLPHVSRSTPLPAMKSISEEPRVPATKKKHPSDSYSSSTQRTSTGDAHMDEIVVSEEDADDSFSSSSSSSEEKPPAKLTAPPRSTLTIKKHVPKEDTSSTSESATAKSEPIPKKTQHQRSKSLSASGSSTSTATFIALPKKKKMKTSPKNGKD